MKKSNVAMISIGAFLAGFCLCLAIGMNTGHTATAKKLKAECEENMPRSQQCVMRFTDD